MRTVLPSGRAIQPLSHIRISQVNIGTLALGVSSRGLSHGLVVLLALVAALLSTASLAITRANVFSLEAPVWEFRPPSLSSLAIKPGQTLRNLQLPQIVEKPPAVESSRRATILEYLVQPGDTLSTIAQRFGISTATLAQANNLPNENRLAVGGKLVIPPVSGALHPVKKGDTLLSIAVLYRVQVDDIVAYGPNGIANPNELQIGQRLVIPGGTAPPRAVATPVPAPRPAPVAAAQPQAPARAAAQPAPAPQPRRGTGQFAWPTTGPLFTYFSAWHPGLDISPRWGTPIYAADAGRVISIQQLSWGYGWHLYLDHGNGYVTLYAHVSSFAVNVGDYVSRGQFIARVGSTGRSSGPHLHFEIRYNGIPLNPLNYLP